MTGNDIVDATHKNNNFDLKDFNFFSR